MRTPICWTERLDDGRKRSIEVSFSGKDQILWRIKVVSKEEIIVSSDPTSDDWNALIAIAEKWYVRRRIPYKYLQLLRNFMNK